MRKAGCSERGSSPSRSRRESADEVMRELESMPSWAGKEDGDDGKEETEDGREATKAEARDPEPTNRLDDGEREEDGDEEKEEEEEEYSKRQRAEHPSKSDIFPSSHCSPISTNPLPQKERESEREEEALLILEDDESCEEKLEL